MNTVVAERKLYSIRDFAAKHASWTSESALRAMIFDAPETGLDIAIRRVGRRVLIDEGLFYEWLDNRNARPASAKKTG